ncbi:MAG: hypothetical protein CL583_18440 [Alteromonadaceae bacterium]|mgnify:CR=1 FL=1|nr:hypothetical protein [Alteromonadaceae bacterium]|tara:strand:- start:2919 stop:3650 length:732 start_codon:yes stop_codon:yes gene_type:complete
MYGVFCQYYEHTSVETFIADLSKKDGAILVRTRHDKRVIGFSTVVNMKFNIGDTRGRGVFSGDTIIEKKYWGNNALHMAFFRYVLLQKFKSPSTPVFWLLISKGYKTYLLLANNFIDYYPNPENRNGELSKVVRSYCDELFPGHFDPKRGVLDFGETAQRLRGDVAAISEDLKSRYPKINFFEQSNPTWQQGTELPCVGVINFRAIGSYVVKSLRKPMAARKAAAAAKAENVAGVAQQVGRVQ